MTKLDGQSKNIINENIEKLKEIFPEVFSEDKIDFEKLQEELGEFRDKENERYNFTWNGKQQAKKIAQTQSTGTLRPCKEESKNFDTTQNLYIEGDNLEVLKLLQKSYHKKVKMIYIDPPYNTGEDFVYKDNFKDNIKNYLEITGQVDSEGNKFSANSNVSGRYHSNWLSMMYPRLKLARNLLKDDGVIFISIGDKELSNMEKVCNEIYGEDNKIGFISRVQKRGSDKGTYFKPSLDYILVYAKNTNNLNGFKIGVDSSKFKKVEELGDRKGELYEDSKSLYQSSLDPMRGCVNQRYYIKCPDGSFVIPKGNVFPDVIKNGEKISPTSKDDGVWRWGRDSYLEQQDLLTFKKTKSSPLVDENGEQSKWNVYTKRYLLDAEEKGNIPSNLFENFLNAQGTTLLKVLNLDFSFSKPVELISYLIEIMNFDGELILDFFSGSATTANATINFNSLKHKNNKFIMVQLPEDIDGNNGGTKYNFKNICEIGKERIRRAGEKIVKESGNTDLDIGFKVLKLDSSNIKEWDSDFEDLEQNLLGNVDNIKSDRNSEDLLYEILLKYGFELTTSIEEKIINDKKVYIIGFGVLVVCLDETIDIQTVEEIAKLKKEYKSETIRVVFQDSSFKDAVVKTNAIEVLKQNGIDEIVSI
ncbi:MAG: Type III restriction-modification system methylation subunit (EC [uncultured Campylobacterales bacterium]|uniref:site-specific DNA-methyltransferase (adenine-specific) n=1 Tax=uncultured Campylobacterales bacterium TaxID=352960 RepID=A0A6S6T0Q3_9BACT|nr:MAG: Type III restriction-modification system methylation subunit (EC [uncultured Campylobacterales bacterium]